MRILWILRSLPMGCGTNVRDGCGPNVRDVNEFFATLFTGLSIIIWGARV